MQSSSSKQQPFKAPPGGLQFGGSLVSEMMESPSSVLDTPTTTRDGKMEAMEELRLPGSPMMERRMLDNQANSLRRSRNRAAQKEGFVESAKQVRATNPSRDYGNLAEVSILAYTSLLGNSGAAAGTYEEVYVGDLMFDRHTEALYSLVDVGAPAFEEDSMLAAHRHAC